MKKFWLWVLLAVVAIGLILGLIGLFASLHAYTELKTAKVSLFSARDALANQDIEQASAKFAEAETHLNNAGASLRKHNISVGFLRIVPYAGTQIRAADGFIKIGLDVSAAGTQFCQAAAGIPGLDKSVASDGFEVGRMVDAMNDLSTHLAGVQESLEAASAKSAGIRSSFLMGSAASIKQQLDEQLNSTLEDLSNARKLMAAFTAIMGSEVDSPKRYLLLQQDCFELRPSGGLIASYGVLECTHDSIGLPEYGRASAKLPKGLEVGAALPPPFERFGSTLRFWDAGWWPDFPATIGAISQIWALNGQEPVSGYIAVDPVAIQYVLEKLGPLQVPEFGETITADNLAEKVLNYLEVQHNADFLKSLAADFFQRITKAPPSQWFSIGRAFGKALTEKHMLLYFTDPGIQATFSELNWSGRMQDTEQDYLMAVDCNVGGNSRGYKANLYIGPRLQVDITGESDGSLRHRVAYTFDNTFGTTTYYSYLRLFVPQDSIPVTTPRVVDLGIDMGKLSLAQGVEVPVGQVVKVEFEYITPAYRSLTIQKQPGQWNMPVRLTLDNKNAFPAEEQELVNEMQVDLSP